MLRLEKIMEYRREIDGIRAVAVIPVIFFHAGFESFSGGFVGVDVFFVISGYLITSIILAEIDRGKFSLLKFYERRARRILPALFFVMLVSFPLAWNWLLPNAMKDFSQSLIAVSFFASNILFWVESGYFDAAAELKPLLHTWSLAVEEQYYVLFPLLLMLVGGLRKRWIFGTICVIGIASLIAAELGSKTAPAATFFLLPTRAWELMIGASVAFLFMYGGPILAQIRSFRFLAEAMGGIGFCLILLAVVQFDETIPFPSLYALVPTVGTAMIITFADANTLVGRALGSRFLVGIGLVSYSAYLWHQPLFAFARHRSLTEPEPWVFLVLSLLTMMLAFLSWRYVERPFRQRGVISRKSVFSFAAGGSLVFVSVGLAGQLTVGFDSRLPVELSNQIRIAVNRSGANSVECIKGIQGMGLPQGTCVLMKGGDNHVLLMGDSHAGALSAAVFSELQGRDLAFAKRVFYACPPVSDVQRLDRAEKSECLQFNQHTWDWLAADKSTEYVIIASRWTLNLEGTRFDNAEGGRELGEQAVLGKSRDGVEVELSYSEIQAAYKQSVLDLLSMGKKVVLIYPVPEMGWNVPDYIGRWSLLRERPYSDEPRVASTSASQFDLRNRGVYQAFDLLGDHPNLRRVIPGHLFCNKSSEGRCAAHLDGEILYSDDNHLTKAGASLVAREISRAIDSWR